MLCTCMYVTVHVQYMSGPSYITVKQTCTYARTCTHLLRVVWCEGKEGGDVEHDLQLLELGVDTQLPSQVLVTVQASQETLEPM